MNPNQRPSSPYAPQVGVPVNNQEDPLGSSVIMRGLQGFWGGRQNQIHEDNAQGNVMASSIHGGGPLPDPQWQGFYQAMQEHAPGGVAPAHGHGDPMPGLGNSPMASPSTMWDSRQSSAVTGQPFQAPNYSTAQYANNSALNGLRKQADAGVKAKYPGVQ